MVMKCIIVAYDKNRAIGAGGNIPWMGKLPADMRHFRELTTGHAIIMGRKTYESIGQALPHRQNIVVSHHAITIEGIEIANNLDQAYQLAKGQDKVFIIGGGQIYKQAIKDIDVIYATEIDTISTGDIHFPKLPGTWQEISRQNHLTDDKNKFNYSFVHYARA